MDKIYGESNLDILQQFFWQLKINAQSTPTKLGDGQNRYLALVLTEDQYNTITNTALFIRPTDPDLFQYVSAIQIILTPTTPIRITRSRATSAPGTTRAQQTKSGYPTSSTNFTQTAITLVGVTS